MTQPLSIPMLAVIAMVGCAVATPADPAEDPALTAVMAQGPATPERPFRLHGDAVLQGQDLAPGYGPPEFGKSLFNGRCSVPSDFMIRFSVQAKATHMGLVSISVEHCTQIDFQAGLRSTTDGVLVITAANGDQLRTNYSGGPHDLGPGLEEHHIFAGGTGAFTGASGEALSRALCDQASGTCLFEMEGSVAYGAFGRRHR